MPTKTNRASELVEVRISRSWIRLIKFVASVIPNGTMTIQFVNGQPTKSVGVPKPDIRFDKEAAVPQSLDFEFVAEEESET